MRSKCRGSKGCRGEVWRTLNRLQFERVSLNVCCCGSVQLELKKKEKKTAQLLWALCLSPIPLWPNSPEVSTCLSKFCTNYQNGKWVSVLWIRSAFSRVVDIYFAWSCRTEATFWWGRVEVNTSLKTMTDAVARYKFTMASSLSSNCQQHQRASGEPSAKMWGEKKRAEQKREAEFVTVSITLQKNLPGSSAWQISPVPRWGSASVKQELLLWST